MTADNQTARRLIELNTEFYRLQAASFSQTRHSAWAGWERLADGLSLGNHAKVLDLACGNLRFERFLQERFPRTRLEFDAIDNCPALSAGAEGIPVRDLDLAQALLEGQGPELSEHDLAVSFGFMHHLPTFEMRCALLELLARATAPGGVFAVSCWQFMDDEGLAAKAEQTTTRGISELGLTGLGPRDYLIGWQTRPGVYRYCHHFDDAEVDALAAHLAGRAQLVDSYRADGRTGRLNRYLVFKRTRLG